MSPTSNSNAIDDFNLVIRLRVVSSVYLELSAAQTKELTPKITGENWVPIRNEATREAVEFAHHV